MRTTPGVINDRPHHDSDSHRTTDILLTENLRMFPSTHPYIAFPFRLDHCPYVVTLMAPTRRGPWTVDHVGPTHITGGGASRLLAEVLAAGVYSLCTCDAATGNHTEHGLIRTPVHLLLPISAF